MDVEIRGIDRGEIPEVLRVDSLLFGYAPEDEPADLRHLPIERMLCAFDGGRMVGTSAVLPLEVTLPGGAGVAMAGVTWVGVLATHRRRGIMRRLVVEQLTRAEQAGEPVAGLGASQSLLYRRFGFGPASRAAHVELESTHAAFIDPAPPDGSLQHIELAEALDVLPRLHDRIRKQRNGMVSRTPALHRRAYDDAAKEKDGAGPVCFVAHRDAGGEIDGVVAYRFRLHVDPGELFDGDYLGWLRPHLEETHRVLAPHGSLYFHIDPRESHYCKVLLDSVFGRDCFRNEVIWAYDYGARSARRWSPKHDVILVYARDAQLCHFDAGEVERVPYMAPGLVTPAKAARGKLPTDVWWHTIVPTNSRERTGYPTQKPLGVVRRAVAASSRPGDLVLDWCAGSGTTGVAAHQLQRRFLLVDNSDAAIAVMRKRLAGVAGLQTVSGDATALLRRTS